MLVKICGITRVQDAEAAVAAGASALGFVFWPGSPRAIDPFRARAIVRTLPPFVSAVGVFVNQRPDYVASVASLVHLSAVQLHGDEAPADFASFGWPVIKAFPVAQASDPAIVGAWPGRTMLLLDVHDPVRRGGTGRTVDWTAAAAIAARRPVLLAGGLTTDNIVEAVARVKPFGVDVSSGVESAPGIKDPARIAAFFSRLHSSRTDAHAHSSARS